MIGTASCVDCCPAKAPGIAALRRPVQTAQHLLQSKNDSAVICVLASSSHDGDQADSMVIE